jgi:hypothetical protein
MDDRDLDDRLTTQDHERREWYPTDMILVGIAFVAIVALLSLCTLVPWGWGGINGF